MFVFFIPSVTNAAKERVEIPTATSLLEGLMSAAQAAALDAVTSGVAAQWGYKKLTAANAPYVAQAADTILGVNNTSLAVYGVTLPAGAEAGRLITVKDESGTAAARNIAISPPAGTTLDGAASKSITGNYGSGMFYCDGSNWFTQAVL